MYHDLDAFLILKLIEINHGKKAMYKKAVDIYKGKVKAKPEVAQGFIKKCILDRNVESASRKLDNYIDDYLYYALPARKLGDKSVMGMVIHNGVVWGIDVTYETEEDLLWARENETEIYTAALFWLIWHYRIVDNIEAEFLMFANWGFKGIPRWWAIKNIGGPVPYKDLLYYPGEGEVLQATFTHNELAAQQAARRNRLGDETTVAQL